MPIRCKLISPTNLMLEHPLLSPVDESEFVVLGKKEAQRIRKEHILFGGLIGAAITVLVYGILELVLAAFR